MSTTPHPVAPEEIMALLDRELRVDRAESVSKHLESCTECQNVAGSLSQTSKQVAVWMIPMATDNARFESQLFELALDASLRPHSPANVRPGAFLRRHWVLTAASSAIAIGLLFLTITGSRLPETAHGRAVDLARTNTDGLVVDGQPLTDAQSKTFSSRMPAEIRSDKLHRAGDSLKAFVAPSAAADRNGIFHGAENAFSGPMIARSISLMIIAKDFNASRASLDAILARHHGYAASLTANTEQNAARSLQASIRVPAAELNAAVAELKSLGRVENEAQNGEEVTQQHADLVARLKNSRETEQRMQAILQQRAGKISDVLEVEQEIARVRGEIEQMEAEQKSLEHRVDFATIDLKLSEEYKAQLNSPSPSISTRFHNAFVAGYRDAVETLVGILLFFAEYGPSLLIWLAIFLPIGWLLWRRWHRGYAVASQLSAQ